jgi:hypothetical protein
MPNLTNRIEVTKYRMANGDMTGSCRGIWNQRTEGPISVKAGSVENIAFLRIA